MSFILHPQSGSYSIIERIYEVDTASKKQVRLECVVEEGLSFARAKAVLKHLIQQASVVKDIEEVSPIETDTPIENSLPNHAEVLKSNAGFYIGRTFDGMPYDRLSGYFIDEDSAKAQLPLYQ